MNIAIKRNELRKQFKKEKGIKWMNSQEEPDIDYVYWLEEKIINLPREVRRYGEIHLYKIPETIRRIVDKVTIGNKEYRLTVGDIKVGDIVYNPLSNRIKKVGDEENLKYANETYYKVIQ
jgi:hypothetical protein